MRDFPIFTTDYGVSSLILKEIPYKNEAYIRIRDVSGGYFREHLEECVKFCKMAGADHVYAAGHDDLARYPLYTAIYEMRGEAWSDEEKVENLFPVTEETVSQWRQICNQRLRPVACSATQTSKEEREILSSGGAYFIHHGGQLLGIGWIHDGVLLTVAAVERGAGERVMHTLMSLMEGERMTLEVASTNERAIRLYEKLGFIKTMEKTRWYDVTNS